MKANVLLLLILLTAPLFIQGVFDHALWINDEAHVAEIGREMFQSGDIVVPRLNGEPFVEKPPLYFMAMCLSYHFFGITPGAARLPSAVFGFLTVLVVYAIAAAYGNKRQGLIAGFILASCSMIFRFSHWCVVDSGVCFFTTLAFFTFLQAYKSESAKPWWYLAFFMSCALAFMTKGLIGPAMVGAAVVALLVWDRNLPELKRMNLWVGIPLFIIIVAPWCYLLWEVGGVEVSKDFWIHNNFGRFSNAVSSHHAEHARGFFFYYYDFLGNFFPWTPILIPAFIWAMKKSGGQQESARSLYRFLLAGFIVNIFIVSFSSTKRGVYILPLYPLATLIIAGWLDEFLNEKLPIKWDRVFLWLQVAVICIFPLAMVGMVMYYGRMKLTMMAMLWLTFLALGFLVIRAFRSGNISRMYRNAAIQIVLTYTAVVSLVFPLISPFKHHTPFFDSMFGWVLPKDFVAIYGNIHESNLGQANISLGRIIPIISDPKQVACLLNAHDRRVFIIAEGKCSDDLEQVVDYSRVRKIQEQQLKNPMNSHQRKRLTYFSNQILP